MSPAADAARYHRLQLVLGLAGFALGAAYLLLVLASGAARALGQAVAELTSAWWVQVVLVTAVLGIGHAVLTLPLGWTRGFWLPRRYDLLHQPLGAWLLDRAKGAALGGALGLAGVLVVYAL